MSNPNQKSDTLVRLECDKCFKLLGEATGVCIVRIKCKRCSTLNEFSLPDLKIKPIYNKVQNQTSIEGAIKRNGLIKIRKKNSIQNDLGVTS